MNHTLTKLDRTQSSLEQSIPLTNTTKEADYKTLAIVNELEELVVGVVVLNHANRYYSSIAEACEALAEHTPYTEGTLENKTYAYQKRKAIKKAQAEKIELEVEEARKKIEDNKQRPSGEKSPVMRYAQLFDPL